MKKYIALLIFSICLLTIPLQAQKNDDLWFKGEVELESGERIQGMLSFYTDNKKGLLQINTGEKILAFDAQQVVQFRFYDELLSRNRQFYSLPFARADQNYNIFLFFEALYEGPHISLLSKIIVRQETRSRNISAIERKYYVPNWYNNNSPRTYSIWVPYETLYLVTPQTDITQYNNPSPLDRDNPRLNKPNEALVKKMMRDNWARMESFIEQNKLDYRRRTDLIRMVAYYNELKEEASAAK